VFRSAPAAAAAPEPTPAPLAPALTAAGERQGAGATAWEPLATLQETRFYTKYRQGRRREAVEDLRADFPVFLAAVGLDPALAERFAKFLVDHAADPTVDRREPVVPQWLRHFARAELSFAELPYEPTPADWSAFLERSVLARLLEDGLPGESDEMRELRDGARRARLRQIARLPSFFQEQGASDAALDDCDRLCAEARNRLNRIRWRVSSREVA
jgi:hypothetical protein